MSRRILGRATIRVNGKVYDSEPGAEIVPGGTKNASRPADRRVFYSQSFMGSRITCRVPVLEGMSLTELQEIADAEVTFEADTGQTWIQRNAVQTAEVASATGPSGGFAGLTFEGDPCEEMIQ